MDMESNLFVEFSDREAEDSGFRGFKNVVEDVSDGSWTACLVPAGCSHLVDIAGVKGFTRAKAYLSGVRLKDGGRCVYCERF